MTKADPGVGANSFDRAESPLAGTPTGAAEAVAGAAAVGRSVAVVVDVVDVMVVDTVAAVDVFVTRPSVGAGAGVEGEVTTVAAASESEAAAVVEAVVGVVVAAVLEGFFQASRPARFILIYTTHA
jgi:hypothetical protein